MVEETPESAPEESSIVAENSHAMEIEESPQDVAKSLEEGSASRRLLEEMHGSRKGPPGLLDSAAADPPHALSRYLQNVSYPGRH